MPRRVQPLMLHKHGFLRADFLPTRSRVIHAISPKGRCLTSQAADPNNTILHIPSASIYRFSASNAANPLINLDWTIKGGESWAIIGNAADKKAALLETLKGQTRINPPPPKGIWPSLYDQGLNPGDHVHSVSFAHRPRSAGGGGFYDYSARYGAVREEDAVSLRQSLYQSAQLEGGMEEAVTSLVEALELTKFLDLPLVALSNGQTRRARIVKALLKSPKILLLDEPLTGLDTHHRPRLMSLLYTLHQKQTPHIIISLRIQDPVPDWVSHVAFVQPGGRVVTGDKSTVLAQVDKGTTSPVDTTDTLTKEYNVLPESQRAVLVDLQGVNVAYHERHILKNINWTIREGERWILQGPNGSGKTTLLSMITGDHPQSYTQPHLHLFGMPRRRIATPAIARRIGICSPELYNAFPRRTGSLGLTVRDAIGTGFDGIFTYRKATLEQNVRIDSLLEELGPVAWSENAGPSDTEAFGKRIFADLTPGEQSLVLLLRAIVNEPELLILDEALSGMDPRMVDVTRKYLRERFGEKRAIVWVSHWDLEAPWRAKDGVQKFSIDNGIGKRG